MRYTPFDVDLYDVAEAHLAGLRDVAEGWYVEYKSESPKPRDLAKILSSFANRYGGWLFLGVQEDPADNTARSFPGIPDADVPQAVEQLRNAGKDLLQPTVPYFHRVLSGPLDSLSLQAGRSIVVVRIPEGASTPYIHNDGRIYVRTGDSSSPVPATDRATFDLLHRKAEEKASLIGDLIDRSPPVSKGEEDTSYLHVVLCSDPFRVLGHWYSGSFSDFSTAMSANPLPFDNIFTSQDGFVARQARSNERYNRLFTWEFSRGCNSFVTLPLTSLSVPPASTEGSPFDLEEWSPYAHGKEFSVTLAERNLDGSRVLNLNMLITLLAGVMARHRTLAGHAGVRGPFYAKAIMENVWRAIPFIDTEEYMHHVGTFDVPVVQDSDVTAPLGSWPEGFVLMPELDEVPSEDNPVVYEDATILWMAIMQALGIPGEVLARSSTKVLSVAVQEAQRHHNRLTD